MHRFSVRDDIYRQIMGHAWHPNRQAFVQRYDTGVLDASVLLIPLVKFIAPPRAGCRRSFYQEGASFGQPRLPLEPDYFA